jgi:hypothetical protein
VLKLINKERTTGITFLNPSKTVSYQTYTYTRIRDEERIQAQRNVVLNQNFWAFLQDHERTVPKNMP